MNMKRWLAFLSLASLSLVAYYVALPGLQASPAPPPAKVRRLSPGQKMKKMGRKEWVAKCLREMQSVKVGMTRKDLAKVLTTEGGLYSPGWGHYVHPECPYFKVDVEFAFTRDKSGYGVWKPTDKITKVSKPYLEWEIGD